MVATQVPLETSSSAERHERGWLRATWPLHWSDLASFGAAYVTLTACFAGIGWLIVGPLAGSGVVRADTRIERWFAGHRTPALDRATWVGSGLAETVTKVVVTAIVVGILLKVLHRWVDALVVATALILEACVFITVTFLVGRDRPAVSHLDSSPVGSSFPSGHTAAAVCYAALAVVVFWHTRNRWIRALTVVLTAAIPIAVGLSRMYRGMHHLTDVLAGAALGAASVAIALWIVSRAEARRRAACC